ncbi:hypothetical protein SNEBB_000584 [Seison nebaliae]|nr:hypothetical protein SNEBB_000584 [Seison nebaliae]
MKLKWNDQSHELNDEMIRKRYSNIDIDQALCETTKNKSGWGFHQIRTYAIIGLLFSYVTGFELCFQVFFAYSPEFVCKTDGLDKKILNDSDKDPRCYTTNYNNLTNEFNVVKCEEWDFINPQFYSYVVEYNLVCDKSFLAELIISLQGVAAVCGIFVWPQLLDSKGRRSIIYICCLSFSILGLAAVMTTNVIFYTIFAVSGSFFSSVIPVGVFTHILEIFPTNERTIAGITIQLFWYFATLFLPFYAYLIRSWRYVKLANYLLTLLLCGTYFFSSESLIWLVSVHKYKKAEELYKEMKKSNGINEQRCLWEFKKDVKDKHSLSHKVDNNGNDSNVENGPEEKKEKIYHLTDLFTTWRIFIITLTLFLIYCLNFLVYTGLILTSASMTQNLFLGTFINILCEGPAYVICYPLLYRFGRRKVTIITQIAAGISLLFSCLEIIITMNSLSKNIITLISYFSGRFFITISFSIFVIYAPEIFPTTLRASGAGMCSLGTRVISVILPFISLYLQKINPMFPRLIFVCGALGSGILTLILPETLGRPLPSTIEETVALSKYLSEEEKESAKEQSRSLWKHIKFLMRTVAK